MGYSLPVIPPFTLMTMTVSCNSKDKYLCLFVCLYMFLLYVIVGLQVGITSATIITSPSYALEICVSTTSGILQSGITLTVSLTAAVQAQG